MALGRPRKTKYVKNDPKTKVFSPRGNAGRPGHLFLKYEEFEAVRLCDHAGLHQADAALSMGISQQTLSRILRRGRKVVAEALVLGKIIRISGGDFKIYDA